MVDVPFPTSSNPGSAPGEGAGRLINTYAYMDGGAARWKPVPGLDLFASLPAGNVRGWIVSLGFVILVAGNVVIQLDAGGGVTLLEGNVPGDDLVTMSINNASPPQVVISSSDGLFALIGGVVTNYSTGTVTEDFTPAALPPINSVTILDGYFLMTTALAQIWASDLNTTNVNALSFSQAESRPDGLLRGVAYGEQYFAFGEETIEVFQDAGTLPFPLARALVIPIGLLSQWAVAGFEDGWGGPLIFVAQDGSVRLLNGYTPQRISGDDLEKLIANVAVKSTLRASIYTFGGNAIWSLSSPDWTWEYNVTTSSWHERQSYLGTGWRGGITIKAFDKWLVADATGGAVYAINADTRTEGSDPLIWGMDAGAVKQFPSRIQVPGAAFDFVLGQAAILGDPQVMLSWSHDGGATWANPVTRPIGKQGRERGRVSINRCGLTTPAGIRWRFRVSDPAYSSFAGSRMDAADRK